MSVAARNVAARLAPLGIGRLGGERVSGAVQLVRAWWLILGVSTLLLVVDPSLRVTFRHDALSFTIDTFTALVATMVAFVGLARYVFDRRPLDLAIAAAFSAVAVSSLWFGLILPFKGHPFHGSASAALYGWLFTRFVVVVLLLLGLARRTPGRLPPRRAELWLAGVVALVTAVDVGLWYGRGWLPRLLGRDAWAPLMFRRDPITIPILAGQTELGIVLESVVALLYCWLALRLTAAVREGENAWLALSLITAAVAEVQFVFYPAPFHPAITTADFLWLVSYLLLLVYLGSQFVRASSEARRQQVRTSALLALSQTPVVNRDPTLVSEAASRAARVVAPEATVAVELGGQADDGANEQRYPISADGTSYGWLTVTPLRRPLAHDTEAYLRIVANQTASLLRAIALYAELEEGAVRDERAQLARELHDGLAQDLAVLRLRFGHESREAGQLVDRALSEARYAITVLRGHTAAPTDFVDAVRRLAEELAGRFGCPVEVAQQEAMLDVPAPVQVALLRIIREAVINAGKHGHPSRVVVALREQAGAIEVEVRDDGSGFDAEAPLPLGRYGLRGIRERVTLLGGTVAIVSRPGEGTRVRVVLPAGSRRERSA